MERIQRETYMDIAKLLLEYLQTLIWPAVVIFAVARHGSALIAVFDKSKIKLKLYGVELEVNLQDLQGVLTAALHGELSPQQWTLLVKLRDAGPISIDSAGFKMDLDGDLRWIRPIRNAGLILSLPDDKYIELATTLQLTQLGRLLVDASRRRPATEPKPQASAA
jgi:hypothetical protein